MRDGVSLGIKEYLASIIRSMDTVSNASGWGRSEVGPSNNRGLFLSSINYNTGITENTRYRAFATLGSYVFY